MFPERGDIRSSCPCSLPVIQAKDIVIQDISSTNAMARSALKTPTTWTTAQNSKQLTKTQILKTQDKTPQGRSDQNQSSREASTRLLKYSEDLVDSLSPLWRRK